MPPSDAAVVVERLRHLDMSVQPEMLLWLGVAVAALILLRWWNRRPRLVAASSTAGFRIGDMPRPSHAFAYVASALAGVLVAAVFVGVPVGFAFLGAFFVVTAAFVGEAAFALHSAGIVRSHTGGNE